MPRIRDPNRDKAFELYKEHSGNIDLVEIASQLSVPPGTIRGWKAKDKWEQQLNGTLQKKEVKNTERSKQKKSIKQKPVTFKKTEVIEQNELNDKQKLFCLYYIEERFNKTKAYMKAYGCNYATARTSGPRMFTNVRIKQEIERITNEVLDESEVNVKLLARRIVEQYISIAFADITDYLEFGKKDIVIDTKEDGQPIMIKANYVDFKESTEVDGSLISEVKQGKDGISVKLCDKMKALQWLSDRTDLLTTIEQRKLELEQQKVAIAKAKVDSPEDEEIEDDGFVDALKGKVDEIWED